MNIRYCHHKDIDIDKWEGCVSNSLNACVYGHAWYLNNISLTWDAIIMGDYDAVMPVFCDADRMYMPYGMLWTGIYCKDGLTRNICQAFIDLIDNKFKYVNISLDKYFVEGVRGKGRFDAEHVYQMDTLKGISNLHIQELTGNANYARYTCRDHIPNTVRAVVYSDFLDIDKSLSFKTSMTLKNLANKSVVYKFGYYSELLERGVSVKGAALAVFSDSYIYLPFFGVSGLSQDDLYGRVLLLSHMVNRYFRQRPGIIVIDQKKSGIPHFALEKMGFKKYAYCRYKVDMLSKITNLFKTSNRQTQFSE